MALYIEDFRVSAEEREGLVGISINFAIYWLSQDSIIKFDLATYLGLCPN